MKCIKALGRCERKVRQMNKNACVKLIVIAVMIPVIMIGCFEAVKIGDYLNESSMFYLMISAPSIGYILIGAGLGVLMSAITDYTITGKSYLILMIVLLLLSLMPLFYYITLIPRLMWESSYVFQIAFGMNLVMGIVSYVKKRKLNNQGCR